MRRLVEMLRALFGLSNVDRSNQAKAITEMKVKSDATLARADRALASYRRVRIGR